MIKPKIILIFSTFILFVFVVISVYLHFYKFDFEQNISKVKNEYYPIMRGESNIKLSKLAIGLQLYEQGKYSEAIQHLNIENNDTAKYFSALSYSYNHEDEMAIILFEELLDKSVFKNDCAQHLAEIAYKKNLFNESITNLEKNMDRNSEFIQNL
jgi:hypothetical protein